jgi:hypothetical protein
MKWKKLNSKIKDTKKIFKDNNPKINKDKDKSKDWKNKLINFQENSVKSIKIIQVKIMVTILLTLDIIVHFLKKMKVNLTN